MNLWDCYIPSAVKLHMLITIRLYTFCKYRVVSPTGPVCLHKVVRVWHYSLRGN